MGFFVNRQASLLESEGCENFLLTLPYFPSVIFSSLIVDVVWVKKKSKAAGILLPVLPQAAEI